MATLKVIAKYQAGKPGQTIWISNLENPAHDYTNFRLQIIVDGVVHHERNFTYWSTSKSFSWYDDIALTTGWIITAKAWATIGGVEYYIGGTNVPRPVINFTPELDGQAPGVGWQNIGVRNLNQPFNTNNYKTAVFNDRGCIEGSTVYPSGIYAGFGVPTPEVNTSNTYIVGGYVEADEMLARGQMVFMCVQSIDGRWYNLGYTMAPS